MAIKQARTATTSLARTVGKVALKIERLVADVRDYASNPANAAFQRLGTDTQEHMLAPLVRAVETLRGEDPAGAACHVLGDTEVSDLGRTLPDRFWTPQRAISLRWAVKSALGGLDAAVRKAEAAATQPGGGQRARRERRPEAVDTKKEAPVLVTSTAAPTNATPKIRATFHITLPLLQEARDAVVHLSGPPLRLTLAALAERALRAELGHLKREHNAGRDFPRHAAPLKGGRPIKS